MDSLTLLSLWVILITVLGGLVVLLISVVTQMRWMVPFVPTPRPVIAAMIDLAQLKPCQVVFDLGAGDGRVLLAAEKREPKICATGYEGALGVWMLSKARVALRRSNVQMRMKNFMTEDFSKADVIFTYLSIAMMKALKPKFDRELKKGARVITHAFRVPDMQPDKEAVVKMPLWGGSRVYRYVWK